MRGIISEDLTPPRFATSPALWKLAVLAGVRAAGTHLGTIGLYHHREFIPQPQTQLPAYQAAPS